MIDEFRRHRFTSMAVSIECLVVADRDPKNAFAAVEAEFARLDRCFSRFCPTSRLSRLNATGVSRCDDDLVEVVELALAARERTSGRFDPTVHDALVSAGYDRTFAEVPVEAEVAMPPTRPAGGAVAVDRETRTVRLGAGVRLDLGGIVKGWAAERVCELLRAYGPCLVNAAGDIAVRGVPPDGVWPVAVDTPAGEIVLGVSSGGIATSGRDRRRWSRNGRELHHLIDPLTGAPSTSDLVTVTAAGATAVEAEVEAKALFLAGADAAAAEADRRGIPCVLVAEDGRVLRRGGLE